MGVFTKIWANVWSARMEYILNNCVLALLDTPGTTLLGISRILVDEDYRQMIINNLKDPVVKSFWINEYARWREQYRNEAIAPIQNKVGQFLSSAIIRNIVGQVKSTIDMREIMDSQKILILNLSKGRIGEDNSALLGAMMITKIQLAAMSRIDIPEDRRKDFYLYVDEFGYVHWCSQTMKKFQKALDSYSLEDLKEQFYTNKPCNPYCTLGCARTNSRLDWWRKQNHTETD